ncbi:thiamine biosynthesis protein [Candidatus Magnetoovum chiemensis]|nr:thiamine biosynthesis protein [Candidatus Magnetoovum chiemensis]
MAKAIALLSGGLDSTLAILALLKQGIEVTAVTFLTHFGCDISDKSSCSKDPYPTAEKFGFNVKMCHLSEKFLEIVKHPKFGHGKNMNPCIDCRILMLKESKVMMQLMNADFLVTGEVLGQRPMSQRRETFPLIDRQADVEGLVLRPLSAKLLNQTKAEINGLVDRDKLYAFNGRSRKPQMALAKTLGLTDYPSPAGGCLLTDPIYSYRLRELLYFNPNPDFRDINLLKGGRHFRLSNTCKIIIGRDEKENNWLESLATNKDITMRALDCGSPLTLVTSTAASLFDPSSYSDDVLNIACALTARYCDDKHKDNVQVTRYLGINEAIDYRIVKPADNFLIAKHRIEANGEKNRFKSIRL